MADERLRRAERAWHAGGDQRAYLEELRRAQGYWPLEVDRLPWWAVAHVTGSVGKLLIYDRVLSPRDRQAVYDRLCGKWGIRNVASAAGWPFIDPLREAANLDPRQRE